MKKPSALKQGSPNQDTYNIATLQRYVTFCYPLEMNVHDGHNTTYLQRDIVKRDTPNDSAPNNLITTDYSIVDITI